MNHPALALTVRSFRTDNRALYTYSLRFALVVLVLITLAMFQMGMNFIAAPGLQFFTAIVYINLIAISIVAVSFFSSVITEEKEEATLGLLKMTGLNPVSILLGKSFSRLVNGLFLLLAQLPFTLLAVTMGGVDPRQILAAYVALTTYMIFACGLALLISTFSKRTRKAGSRTLTALLIFLFAPQLINFFVHLLLTESIIPSKTPLIDAWVTFYIWATDASILTRIDHILTSGYNGPVFLAFQPLSNIAFAAALFTLAWLIFNLCTRDDSTSAPPTPRQQVSFSIKTETRAPNRFGRVWDNALAWHAYNFNTGGLNGSLKRFVIFGILFALLVFSQFSDADYSFGPRFGWAFIGSTTFNTAILFITIHAVFLASSLFQNEIAEQTLPDIILLPLSIRQITFAKCRGAARALIPAFIWLIIGAAIAPTAFLHRITSVVFDPGAWFALSVGILFLHIVVLISLYAKRAILAIALCVYFFGGICFGIVIEITNLNSILLTILAILIVLAACYGFQLWTAKRLNKLAAL